MANKLLQSYQAQPVIATKLCTTGDLNDFKENERFRLTDVGDLLPIAPDSEIKEGGLVGACEEPVGHLREEFCLTRKMIINDDLGAFMKVPTAMGTEPPASSTSSSSAASWRTPPRPTARRSSPAATRTCSPAHPAHSPQRR